MFRKIKRWLCKLLRHKLQHVKYYPFMTTWEIVECRRCKEKFILNHLTSQILPWDKELDNCGNGIIPGIMKFGYIHDTKPHIVNKRWIENIRKMETNE